MAMVKMRKANRVVNIDSTQLKSYLARGYDQINEDGKVKTQATGGKTISPADYNRTLEENEKLKEQIAQFESNGKASDIDTSKFDEMKEENKEMKSKISELQDEVKTYVEDNERLGNKLKENRNKK